MRAGTIIGGLPVHLPAVVATVLAGGPHPGRALALAAAGAVVGVLVGLTGAGGGALLTPMLVLVFGLPGLTAVGSDLATSLLIKPIGGAVHLRRRTARLDIAGWLCLGSVPAAAGGVALARAVSTPNATWLRPAIGVALLLSAAASLWRHRARHTAAPPVASATIPSAAIPSAAIPSAAIPSAAIPSAAIPSATIPSATIPSAAIPGAAIPSAAIPGAAIPGAAIPIPGTGEPELARISGVQPCRTSARPLLTVLLGAVGGLLVGLTSVGSGSIVLAGLAVLYPDLSPAEMIGTDLVQAVPLVAAAALAHLVAGDVAIPVTVAVLAGAVPGVYLGARASSSGRSRVVRPVITVLLVATGVLMVS